MYVIALLVLLARRDGQPSVGKSEETRFQTEFQPATSYTPVLTHAHRLSPGGWQRSEIPLSPECSDGQDDDDDDDYHGEDAPPSSSTKKKRKPSSSKGKAHAKPNAVSDQLPSQQRSRGATNIVVAGLEGSGHAAMQVVVEGSKGSILI
jgi:hypothetical protein